MRELQPVMTAHLFAPLHEELLVLLRDLGEDDWSRPTAAGTWTVREVAAHLLDTAMRRLSQDRDRYAPPLAPDAFANGLTGLVNRANGDGVALLSRHSAPLLIDQLDRYGSQLTAFLESKDPHAKATWSVSWAGEEESANWFDVARELTERWHHQEQIRDATGRPPLFTYLRPVLDTFVRALPFTYREVAPSDGTSIVLRVTSEGEGAWTVVRETARWKLYEGESPDPTTRVTLRGDVAWRLFTKQKIDPQATIEGDAGLASPLLGMIAIIG
jgi:uncharacterized protein (TIGR03083 family)